MTNRRSLLAFSSAAAFLGLLPAGALFAQTDSLPPAGTWPLTFKDVAGRSVTVKKAPQRIVVANYIANYLLVGGAGALTKVVGLTQDHWESTRMGEYRVFTKAFPAITAIPSIGGYHDDILNTERILALKPDVILIGRSQFAANNQRIALLERVGVAVIVIDYHAMKLENHVLSTRILGRLLERDAVADSLIDECITGLSEITRRIALLPDGRKHRTVYMELGNLGPGQYGNSYNSTILWGAIIKRLNAAGIAETMPEPYGALTREFVLSKNPEIVIIGGSIWGNDHADQMRMGFTVAREDAVRRLEGFKRRPLWENLRAVKTNDFYGVDHGSLRSITDWRMTQFLAKVFYPEAFTDTDPESAILKTYRERLPEIDPSGTFTLSLKTL